MFRAFLRLHNTTSFNLFFTTLDFDKFSPIPQLFDVILLNFKSEEGSLCFDESMQKTMLNKYTLSPPTNPTPPPTTLLHR
jgi:hypothetical protein